MTLEQREQAATLLTEFYPNAYFWVNDDGYIYGYWGATMGPVGEGIVVLADSEAEQRIYDSIKRYNKENDDRNIRHKRFRYDVFSSKYVELMAQRKKRVNISDH